MEKVLLINPPRKVPQQADFLPIGLAYIAAVLEQNGISAKVLDASSFSWEKLEKVVKDNNPVIVGIVCWTIEREQAFKTVKLIKKILPFARIIMGGHHATAFPEHILELGYADAVVIGEGEITTLELVKAFLNNKPLDSIKGIAYKKDNQVIITESRDLIENLDSIPFPNYDDFNLDEYIGLPEIKEKSTAIITSRGCPYNCIFCSASKFWRRKWRGRSAENVLGEIELLYKKYGVRGFMFFDDNFTVNKDRAIKICQGILSKGLNIKWVACSHVNQVDPELLAWMKKAGCYRIDYGVESGSPKILKNIKKGQTVEQIERVFKWTHEAGIKPRAYLIVGNPGEDENTIKETIALLKKIKPYNTPSAQILWVLPDTEIYELAKLKNIVSNDYWLRYDSIIYYTGEHSLKKLQALREQLMKGLAKNQKTPKAYLAYLIRKLYYRYPFLQKLRKMIIKLRQIYENITH